MLSRSGVAGSASLLAYLFAFMTFGIGVGPLLIALVALAIGLAAVASFRGPVRTAIGLCCLAVLTALPATYISVETFSGGFVLVHFYAAGVAWLLFLAVSWTGGVRPGWKPPAPVC